MLVVFTVMQVQTRDSIFILLLTYIFPIKVTLSFIALVTLVVALCLPQKNEKILQRNPDEPSDPRYKSNGNVTQITSRMKSWGPDLYTTKVSSEV